VLQFAKILLPAGHPGPDSDKAFRWLTERSGTEASSFGPLAVSWTGNADFRNLTAFIGDFRLPNVSDIFDDFHVADALDWGKHASLSCSVIKSNVAVDEPDEARCTTTNGPRVALAFRLDVTVSGGYSDTDISCIGARYVPNENSKPVLAHLVEDLITRISGDRFDGTKAKYWVTEYAPTGPATEPEDVATSVLNAELDIKPSDYYGPDTPAEIKIYPAGYSDR
jgi:hypothetical protein